MGEKSKVRQQRQVGRMRTGIAAAVAALLVSGAATAQTVPPPTSPTPTLPTPEQVTPPIPETRQPSMVNVDSRSAFEVSTCPFDDSPLRLDLRRVVYSRPDGTPLPPEIAT